MYDLAILGGGPAGSAAAITAVRSGARTLLLERGRFPRHKVCGEFVSAESLGLLGTLLGLPRATLLQDALRISSARVFLDGRTVSTSIEPSAASIARHDLDAALWETAQLDNVDARQQVTVQGISGTSLFRIATTAGEFETRAVINCSGRWSNLSAAPSADQKVDQEKWIGLKAHFEENSPPASVDLYFFDGGYCGVQPVELDRAAREGRVNACAMVRASVASTMPDVLAQHPMLRERSRSWKPLIDPVSTSPLLFRDPEPVRGEVLQAGDAAGFVDPFVGDGISLALRSGTLAAESLIPFFRAESSLADAVERYRRNYEERLAPVFRASSKIRQVLTLPRSVRVPLLALTENIPAIGRYLVRKTR